MRGSAQSRFQSEIVVGRLFMVNLGVADKPGRATFYVNQVLSEWSSFDREIASRGHPMEEVMVETVTIGELFAAFGVPYYLKIDIEAYDRLWSQAWRDSSSPYVRLG